jgi:HSP20 family protein
MANDREMRVWHPIEDIRSLAESMSRVFDAGSHRGQRLYAGEQKLSLTETPDGFLVTLELPHVSKKDLHVNVAETSVTVFAHWKKETKSTEKGARRVTREEQTYSRVIQLPAPVKADQARASFRDRVLKIFLPRTTPSQVRRIEVK